MSKALQKICFLINAKPRVVGMLVVAFSGFVLFANPAFAAINQEISYQAVLEDSLGNDVANGNYNARFKLYASSTGGTPLWTEEWCKGACNGGAGTDNRIPVTGGLFSIQLGQLTSLSSVDFNQPLWLGVEVGGSLSSSTWDGEMSPRKKIGSSPSAFNSDKLNGQAASYYLDANNLSNLLSRFGTFLSATTTNALAEGSTNLYFTNARARGAIGSNSAGLIYSTSTGVFTLLDAGTATSGLVTTGAQSFAGNKTFTGNIAGNGTLTILSTTNLATTTITGNVGIGATPSGDRLTVSGDVALGHYATNASLAQTTGYGKLYAKSATGDGNDTYTKILLHFDSDSGTSTVTDSSASQLPFTSYGSVQISTSPTHFGTGVLSLNGTNSYAASSPVLDFSSVTTQDEVDTWVYPTSLSGIRPVHYTGLDSTSTYYAMYLNSGVPTFEFQKDGGPLEVSIAGTTSIPINTWTHLALTRKMSGSTYTFSLYVGGSVVATATSSSQLGTTGNTVCLGSDACFGGTNFFSGYLDELRFSRGLARYSNNFNPNTAPYGSGLFYLLDNGVINEMGGGGGGGGGGLNGATVDTLAFHKGGDSFGALQSLGLEDNFGLSFITNNTARLSITNDGKIGVGTTTPDTLFTVAGDAKFTGGLTLLGLTGGLLTVDASGTVSTTSIGAVTNLLSSTGNVITSTVSGVVATTTLVNSNALSWLGNQLTSTINGIATTTSIPYSSTSTDGLVSTTTQTFGGNKTFAGRITGSTTGNILPFSFADQASFPNATTYRGAIAESDGDGAMFFAYGGVWTQLLDIATGFKNGGNSFSALATIGTNDAFALRFIASSSEAMRITTAGRVGIGTTSPLALFDVYGNGMFEGANRYLNFGTATSTAGYGLRDNSGIMQFKNTGGSWTNIATTTDSLAEGLSNLYYTDARARSAFSATATGLTYSTSSGVLSLTSGYNIPLAASTTNWQTFFTTPSTQITAGVGLAWAGNTLKGVIADATTDGLVSSSTQTFGGAKTFNGAVSLGSTLGVTGTSTLATTTVTKFTASDGVTFSSMTAGSVLFAGTGGQLSQSNSALFWDNTNSRLGIGTTTPNGALTFAGLEYGFIGGNSNISQIATASVGSQPIGAALNGKYMYVANSGASTISVLDVSNPASPTNIATINVGGAGPLNVLVSGQYLFVTNNGSSTLSVLDNSTPSSPVLIATTSVGTSPRNEAMSGHYVFTTNNNANTISVVDVSNPYAPRQVATTSVGNAPRGATALGEYLYVANSADNTISVVDISNPLAPLQVATVSTGGGDPRNIFIAGRYAYVANFASSTMAVIDISNPVVPVLKTTTSVGTNPQGISLGGRYAYVGNAGSNNISVLDISNPLAPRSIATTSVGVGPTQLRVNGRYVYVMNTTDGTVSVVDVGGADLGNLYAGSIETGVVQTLSDISAQGNVNVGSSLYVGPGGIQSGGGLSVTSSSSVSVMMGHLAIGTTTATVALQVADNTIRLNDNKNVAPTRNNTGEIGIGSIGTGANNGRIWIRAGATPTNFFFSSTGTGDFSEFFKVNDTTLKTGELVSLDISIGVDASSTRHVARTGQVYDAHLMGVVARPGEGTQNNNDTDGNREFDPKYKNVSLLGQTPVYVTDENGLVQAGDRLTAASRPGYAMKMTHGGMSLGYALDSATSTDQLVEAYVNPGQFMTPEEAGFVSEIISTSTDVTLEGALGGLYRHLIGWFASAANGISDLFARRLITHEICVDDDSGARTCINKQGLDTLLGGAHVNNIYTAPASGGASSSSTTSSTTSTSTEPVASSTAQAIGDGGAATSTDTGTPTSTGESGVATSTETGTSPPTGDGRGATSTTTDQSQTDTGGSGSNAGDTTSTPPPDSATSTTPN